MTVVGDGWATFLPSGKLVCVVLTIRTPCEIVSGRTRSTFQPVSLPSSLPSLGSAQRLSPTFPSIDGVL